MFFDKEWRGSAYAQRCVEKRGSGGVVQVVCAVRWCAQEVLVRVFFFFLIRAAVRRWYADGAEMPSPFIRSDYSISMPTAFRAMLILISVVAHFSLVLSVIRPAHAAHYRPPPDDNTMLFVVATAP